MFPKISAVIITYNEEKNIRRCLASLQGIAEEIVVVDSHSTDRTKEICSRYENVNFISTDWKGFSDTKNYGNDIAKHSWIISLDSDEELSKELKANIASLELKEENAYEFNRLTNYCGKWVKYCGWSPDIKVRLFNKSITSWEGVVHEKLVYTKSISNELIIGDLNHYSYYTEQEHLDRLKKYAQLSAEEKFKAKKGNENYKIIFSPIFKFISVFFLKLGFLDGITGFKIAKNEAKYNYWKYSILKKLHQTNA
ncbi:MAG: glycosyltransferase family 2 protein [Flavobacteriales bacterium]|nr:glycosyltransferase family 2 protein [Flavobacteriales bacterium]